MRTRCLIFGLVKWNASYNMKSFISLCLCYNRSSCEPEDEDFKTCHCWSCPLFVVWEKLIQSYAWKFSTFVGREGHRIPCGSVLCKALCWLCVTCDCAPAARPCWAGGSLHMALLSRCTVLLVPDLTLHLESIRGPLLTVFCDPYFFMDAIIWKSSTFGSFHSSI